jgi:hypothetical protein
MAGGVRSALVIATASYADSRLDRLDAALRDADEMAEVLGNPRVGGYDVISVLDGRARDISIAIEKFLAGRGRDDEVLIYLSCHGLLDEWDRLYFAAADTDKDHLTSTGVAAEWLLGRLEETRSTRQIVILDCCHSGAFARSRGKGADDAELGLKQFFPQGRGRALLAASRAMQRSWVGDSIGGVVASSVFTGALVEGLRTGAADTNGDGLISVDEAYEYAYAEVMAAGVGQHPQKSISRQEGSLILARAPTESEGDKYLRSLSNIKLSLLPEPTANADSEWSDVAERQRRIQADLNEAQKVYTEMAGDRYHWISTMQRRWQRQKPETLRQLEQKDPGALEVPREALGLPPAPPPESS